jgi:hypothetical protein
LVLRFQKLRHSSGWRTRDVNCHGRQSPCKVTRSACMHACMKMLADRIASYRTATALAHGLLPQTQCCSMFVHTAALVLSLCGTHQCHGLSDCRMVLDLSPLLSCYSLQLPAPELLARPRCSLQHQAAPLAQPRHQHTAVRHRQHRKGRNHLGG